jgi:hypothetical protein
VSAYWTESEKTLGEVDSEFKRLNSKLRRFERQDEMETFVAAHGLRCFKCNSSFNPWVKTGAGRRGPWALCVSCVRKGGRSQETH